MKLDIDRQLDPWQLGMSPPRDVRFEFPEEGAVVAPEASAPAPAPVAPEAPAEAPVGEVTPAAPVAPAPGFLTAEDPAFQQVLRVSNELGAALAEAREREASAAREAEQRGITDNLPELDFTNPESVLAHAEHRSMQRLTGVLEEALAPLNSYLPILEQVARDQGATITGEILADLGIPESLGEGDQQVKPREMATQLAAAYMRGGTEPEAAVKLAAEQMKKMLGSLGPAAVNEHIDGATRLRETVPAPGSQGSLTDGNEGERPDPLRPSRYTDVVANVLSAQQPRQPGT